MRWRKMGCPMKKEPSAIGMMDFPLETEGYLQSVVHYKISGHGEYGTYWADTSGNMLISNLIRRSPAKIKTEMEDLLNGRVICTELDEQVIFEQLGRSGEPSGVLCLRADI